MRFQTEIYQVPSVTLNQNNVTTLRTEFPLGDGWYQMFLNLVLTLTVGTGTGAISEGELNILKGIFFKTDIDGPVVNMAGRGLYRLAQIIGGTAPTKDAIAASDGTYRVSFPIHFASPLLIRPEDTILNTARYSNVEMQIILGGVADLLSSPGTASLVATAEIAIVKTHGMLPAEAAPLALPYMIHLPPVNPASQTWIDFERSSDLAYFLFAALASNSASAGVPFSGTPSNVPMTQLNVEDNYGFPVRTQNSFVNQAEAKARYTIESYPTGWYVFDMIKDGSIMSAYPSGDKSKLQLNWTNGTLSTSQVTALSYGVRELKG